MASAAHITYQQQLNLRTAGRGTVEVTREVARVVKESGVQQGLCHLFVQHTSASLMVCENADPRVRGDLERFMARLAPDGDRLFRHDAEGPDDMPAHVRSVLTHVSLQVPVGGGRLLLGAWQGLYLWEHRTSPHDRTIVITVQGG